MQYDISTFVNRAFFFSKINVCNIKTISDTAFRMFVPQRTLLISVLLVCRDI